MSDFNKNLRNELLYNDIQIKEFAGKINLPYSTVLSYLGTAERLPRVDIAVKMAQELGVSVEYLVTGKNSIFNFETKVSASVLVLHPLQVRLSLWPFSFK